MKEKLLSTLLHTLELVVVLAAVYVIVRVLGIEIQPEILTIVLAALAKFGRVNTRDYVNP